MSLLCSRCHRAYHVTFSHHGCSGSSRLWQFLWFSLFWWPGSSEEEVRYFAECLSAAGICLIFFSWLSWGYGNLIMRFLEEHYRDKVSFSLYYFGSIFYQRDFSLMKSPWSPGWGSVCWVSPLWRQPCLPFPNTAFFGKRNISFPWRIPNNLCRYSLRVEKIICNSSAWEIYLHPFIYLLIQSFILVWTRGDLYFGL